MSRKAFVIAVIIVMALALFMPSYLTSDEGGKLTTVNLSFGTDAAGNARMSGIVTLDGVNKNLEMHGKLDGVMGNYSGAMMGNVNGEPAAMYVFHSQKLKYAALAVGAVNENTEPKIYTFGECTDEMYNDIVKRQVRNVAVSHTGVDNFMYNIENPKNCQYRGTYNNAGMKIEMFAPVKMDGVYNNDISSYVCFDEEGLADYVEEKSIKLMENSSRVHYLATGMRMDATKSGLAIVESNSYPDLGDADWLNEDETDEWLLDFEYGDTEWVKCLFKDVSWKMSKEAPKIKTSGQQFRAMYGWQGYYPEATEAKVSYPAVMLVSFLGENGPYALLLQSSDNANCTIELVTE